MGGERGFGAGSMAMLAAALFAFAAPASAAGLPPGFFGTSPQTRLTDHDWKRMQGTVETVRTTFDWGQIEPAPGVWDFTASDALIGAAASRGIRVLPLLYGVPEWLSADPARAPADPSQRTQWARFVRRLVARYGPAGDFWRQRPADRAIRGWQVWNEPNLGIFWRPRPAPARYVALLKTTARAIRSLDAGARIVAAGLAPVQGGVGPAEFLRAMYAVPGARRAFDVAALHPYSFELRQLRHQVAEIRAVMRFGGDEAKPLRITEIGVASTAELPTRFDRGPRGQARFLHQAFNLMASARGRWRIAGVDWFSWRDGPREDPNCAFCRNSGLIDAEGRAKPAWHAYRRSVHAARSSNSGPVR